MRGRTHIEEIGKDREAIVVTEIPYQVNKARMMARIAEVVREKVVEGISDLRDESDRGGVRVVVHLRRDAVPEMVQLGRASCRDRVCQYVYISVVAVSIKNQK